MNSKNLVGQPSYAEKIKELFVDNPFNPQEKITDKKYELLESAAKHFYEVCKPYRNLWIKEDYSPSELKLPEDLDLLLPISTEEFKRYKGVVEDTFPEEPKKSPKGFENYEIFYREKTPQGTLIKAGKRNLFPEEVLCVSKEELDKKYPMVTSSASSGNPSIEYLTPIEKEAIYTSYLNAEKKMINDAEVDKMIVFGPSPEDTPTSQSAIGRDDYRELERTKGENSYYLLSDCKFDFNKIPKRAKELTDEAYKNGESACFGFSTQLFYEFLKEMKNEGYEWNFGEDGYVAIGGGGWDGKKGKILTDAVEPKKFVELVEGVLNIPAENIHDIYGVSEPVPFACYSDWSEKDEAFIHHVPRAYSSLQVVDENDPREVLGEGETGVLKTSTPVAIAQPRISTLIWDLVEPIKIENNEVVDYIFRGRSKQGKDELKGCGLRSSIEGD